MEEESDNVLIQKAVAGQDQAFECLVQRYQNMVAQLVWRLVPLTGDREEICQDVFVKVYFNLEKFRFDSKFSTWLYTVTYRTALSFLRKNQLDTQTYDENLHEEAYTQQDHGDLTALVQNEIGRLGLDERTSITLFHLQGCSIDEISGIMGKPAGTIKNMLFRARAKMKRQLGPKLIDEFREVV